jgi:hypothetical protein
MAQETGCAGWCLMGQETGCAGGAKWLRKLAVPVVLNDSGNWLFRLCQMAPETGCAGGAK